MLPCSASAGEIASTASEFNETHTGRADSGSGTCLVSPSSQCETLIVPEAGPESLGYPCQVEACFWMLASVDRDRPHTSVHWF